jgi:hypothetical protein
MTSTLQGDFLEADRPAQPRSFHTNGVPDAAGSPGEAQLSRVTPRLAAENANRKYLPTLNGAEFGLQKTSRSAPGFLFLLPYWPMCSPLCPRERAPPR